MDYSKFFSNALDRLHHERRYRVFADLERIAGRFPHATWHSSKGPRSRAPDRLVIKAVLATPDHDDGVFGRVLAAQQQERCQVPKALKT